MASNQLAFHAAASALQNATAFSSLYYDFNNRKAVVLTSMALACRVDSPQRIRLSSAALEPVAVVAARWDTSKTASLSIVADASVRYGRVVIPKSVPVSTGVTPLHKVAAKKSAYVWKPGHGAIEKVDRRTGEIFHLCEVAREQAA